MANRVCWQCEVKSHMTRVGEARVIGDEDSNATVLQAVYLCDECDFLSIALAVRYGNYSAGHSDWLDRRATDIRWKPECGTGRSFDDVPPHIAGAASEAYVCLSVNAHRAATLLARSVIEATAKDMGIIAGRLVDKIDARHEQEFIRNTVKDGAHEVRHLGNDMAHGDFVDPVDQEEAEEALELMAEVLHDVYQQDARVSRRRLARLAKKGTPASPVS